MTRARTPVKNPRGGGHPPAPVPQKGRLKIGPNGDRRIVLQDVGGDAKGKGPELSLYQILCDGREIDVGGGQTIRFAPVSIRAMAVIAEMTAQGVGADHGESASKVLNDTVKMATVLVNDGLPDGVPPKSEDEVARLINSRNFAVVVQAITEMCDPLWSGLGTGRVNPSLTGSGSSTGSLASSAGQPRSLAG